MGWDEKVRDTIERLNAAFGGRYWKQEFYSGRIGRWVASHPSRLAFQCALNSNDYVEVEALLNEYYHAYPERLPVLHDTPFQYDPP